MILMKRYFAVLLCALLLLLFYCPAFGQKQSVFVFDTSVALPKGGIYNHVRVIDERPDKSNLGLDKIRFNTKLLVTEKPFADELAEFGENLVRKIAPRADNTLLIVLHQFQVESNVKGFVTTLYLDADYYLSTPLGGYQFLFTVDNLTEVKTTDVRRDINILFAHLFNEAANIKVTLPPKDSIYTQAQAANKLADIKKQLPVYNTSNYKVGVYYTIDQFLNNTPGDTLFKEDDHYVKIGNSPKFYYVDKRGWANGRISEKDFFAVYNGKRWFKSTKDGSFGMDKIDDDFYFKAEKKSIDAYYNNSPFAAVGYISGGLVGGMIVGAVVGAVTTTLDKTADVSNEDITQENPKNGKGHKTEIFYLFKVDPVSKTFIPAKRVQ